MLPVLPAFVANFPATETPGVAVYILTAGTSIKVGASVHPGRRARSIQTGQDLDVCVFWAVRLSHKDAYRVERLVHSALKSKGHHKRGEWFTIDPQSAVEVIKTQIKRYGLESYPDLHYGFAEYL